MLARGNVYAHRLSNGKYLVTGPYKGGWACAFLSRFDNWDPAPADITHHFLGSRAYIEARNRHYALLKVYGERLVTVEATPLPIPKKRGFEFL